MRILLVIVDLDGGAGVFCRNLAAAMHGAFPGEYQVSLLTIRDTPISEADRRLFDEVGTVGVAVHDGWRRFVETRANTRRLREAMARMPSDVVLAVHTYSNLLVPKAAPERAVVLSVHGHLSTLLRPSVTRPVVKWMIRRRYRRHVVVAPSAGVAADLKENFGARDVRVIEHGLDQDRIRLLAQAPAEDLPGEPYFVSVGRLVVEKDYATLLRAYAEARRAGLGHRLVIVGRGEEEARLRRLAEELGIARRVDFRGHRENPYPCVARAEAFVMSSVSEGFGLALVEAMALGRPCIATDCPTGPGEILGRGEYGMLVPMRDPAALGRTMVEMGTSAEARMRYALAAMKRAKDFTLARMAAAYRAVFAEICRSRRGADA